LYLKSFLLEYNNDTFKFHLYNKCPPGVWEQSPHKDYALIQIGISILRLYCVKVIDVQRFHSDDLHRLKVSAIIREKVTWYQQLSARFKQNNQHVNTYEQASAA
jgi:hypothetical protein